MALTKAMRSGIVLLVHVDLQEGCITPVGQRRLQKLLSDEADAQPRDDARRTIRVASGGTTCTDVSQMGAPDRMRRPAQV